MKLTKTQVVFDTNAILHFIEDVFQYKLEELRYTVHPDNLYIRFPNGNSMRIILDNENNVAITELRRKYTSLNPDYEFKYDFGLEHLDVASMIENVLVPKLVKLNGRFM